MRRTQAGITLVELLVSVLMTLVIAGALFSVFTNTYEMRDFVVGQGSAETGARTPIDELADHLRDAQQFWTTGGVTPTLVTQSSVIASGTATSYYKSNSSTDTVRLWLSGTNLERTADGNTSVVLSNVNSLEFQYYKVVPDASGNVNYNVGETCDNTGKNCITLTTDPHVPTAAELPLMAKISIRASVNIDGYSRELACLVRLRNSPYKLKLSP
jgi:hypothetical protein